MVEQVDFLGRTITPNGVAPQADKVKTFLSKLRFPKSKKALQGYIGFLNIYCNFFPGHSERLSPFFKLLKETSKIYGPTNIEDDFTNLNKLGFTKITIALEKRKVKVTAVILLHLSWCMAKRNCTMNSINREAYLKASETSQEERTYSV